MKTWTTETWGAGAPERVLELLTEPDAIARWAPIPFELLDLDGERLVAGTRARVSDERPSRPDRERPATGVLHRPRGSRRRTPTGAGASWNPHLPESNQHHTRRRCT